MIKKTATLILLCITANIFAIECSFCGKNIRGRYWKKPNGDAICSKKCLEKTSPKCARCNKPCISGTFTFFNKTYCSKKCLDKVSKCTSCSKNTPKMHIIISSEGRKVLLCSNCIKKPPCFFCALPLNTSRIYDGRRLCSRCMKNAVRSHAAIKQRVQKIRNQLKNMYGFDPYHRIDVVILPINKLEQQSQNIYKADKSVRLALMRYTYKITERISKSGRRSNRRLTDEKCTLYILDYIPSDRLDDTIAHELTHDYLRHNVGQIKDLKLEEGFAEAVAAKYNTAVKKSHLNLVKENNPDPVYGDGYRMMSKMLRERGWQMTLKYLRTHATPIL